jgi:hypothetical protein
VVSRDRHGEPPRPSAGIGPPGEAGISATALAVTLLGVVVAVVLAVTLAWPWWTERRTAGTASPEAAADVSVPPVTTTVAPTPTVASGTGVTSQPLTPDRLRASASAPAGVDASGQTVTYEVDNLADGQNETAWRVSGSGVGVTLRAEWDAPVTLTSIALVPGYAKVDPTDGSDRFWENRRVLAVRYHFDNGTVVDASFTESPDLQPTTVQVTTRTVTVEITRTTPGPERDYTAISELAFAGAAA